MTIRHDCSRQGCYKECLPDWQILDGCFPRGIRPSDVDGIVELNEYILLLEWKPRYAILSRGQLLLLQNFTRGYLKAQALVIYGDPGQPAEIELYQGGTSRFRQPCDIEFLRWFCQQWGMFADDCRPAERRRGPRRAAGLFTRSQFWTRSNRRHKAGRRSGDQQRVPPAASSIA